MPFQWSSVWIATLGAAVLGVALGYVVAVFQVRWLAIASLPLLAVPMVILTRIPATAILSGLPFVLLISARRLRDLESSYGNAARSHGASEWRIFWRVQMPLAWKAVALASSLAFARIAAESAIAARL